MSDMIDNHQPLPLPLHSTSFSPRSALTDDTLPARTPRQLAEDTWPLRRCCGAPAVAVPVAVAVAVAVPVAVAVAVPVAVAVAVPVAVAVAVPVAVALAEGVAVALAEGISVPVGVSVAVDEVSWSMAVAAAVEGGLTLLKAGRGKVSRVEGWEG